jgi:hypothetical protein
MKAKDARDLTQDYRATPNQPSCDTVVYILGRISIEV